MSMKAVIARPLIPNKEPNATDLLEIRSDVPIPKPGPGQVLIKVEAAAQNGLPDSYKLANPNRETGVPIGDDFAGTVLELGPGVTGDDRFVGERVAGFVLGGLLHEFGGSYAEYCVAEAKVLISIGNDMPFKEAAALGLSTFTAAQGLYQNLTPPLPSPLHPTEETIEILIWGGASIVGLQAIQLAKLSGLTVIATASPKNHDLVKAYGADIVYDYRDPDVVAKIRETTGSKLKYAFDCISSVSTSSAVAQSIGPQGGSAAFVLPPEWGPDPERSDVTSKFALIHTIFGKTLTLPWPIPADETTAKLGVEWSKMLSQLVQLGKLKAPPLFIPEDGFKNIGKWQDWGAAGKASAQKLILLIQELQALAV